jgi:CubicO group peptidase (beta-lactamase class C family)
MRVSADQLQEWTTEARRRWHVPGMAVGVLSGDETVLAADGVLELGSDEPVRPETQFRIASITKPFVATLAMTLVQDGLLSLDEPPPAARTEASIRQLLSHQAGLAIEWPNDLDEDADDEALLRLAAREAERLPVGPGELFSYCNTGYWFVGAGVAHATGTTFEQAMQARVLEPLGLDATGFDVAEGATGHEQTSPGSDEHRPVVDAYPRVRRPSGGLWSNVGDLLRFGVHHAGAPGPLAPESIAELARPQIPLPGGSYGIGWFLFDGRPRRTVEHMGNAAGFQSSLVVVPDERVVFAALTNSSRGLAAVRDVIDRLGLGIASPPAIELAPESLDAFAGHYEGQGLRLECTRAGGSLRVEAAEFNPFTGETVDFPPLEARPVGEREFEVTTPGEWLGDRFDFPRDGLARMMILAQRVE